MDRSSFLQLHSGEELFLSDAARMLLFARVLSANGADLNHGNEPDEIAKSIARVRKRERVYSLKQKSSSFTVTRYSRTLAVWLRHVGPAHINAQKNKGIPAFNVLPRAGCNNVLHARRHF